MRGAAPRPALAAALLLWWSAAQADPAPVSAWAREFHAAAQLELLERAPDLLARFVPVEEGFLLPVAGRLTSGYGWRNISVGGNLFHGGIDLAAPVGTPVRAARSGVVTLAGWSGSYGYAVYLDHGDGTETRYAHLSAVLVEVGAVLRQGDTLGLVGSTGASTGPHLHFELRRAGRAVDPLPVLGAGIGQGAQTGQWGAD